jgi:hypothetical protein
MRQERNDKIGNGIEEDIDAAARTHLKNHVTTLELVSVLSTGLGLFGFKSAHVDPYIAAKA